MDWPESTEPLIAAFPRGRDRDGINPPGLVAEPNPLRWTSRYASLVTTLYGVGTVDGLNEAGLTVHGLYLQVADFGPRDPAKPAIAATMWLQYLLDQAATVAEALALLENVDILKVRAHGHDSNLHLAMEDATGDSAVVEYVEGKRVVHHGRQYTLTTNDPTYDEQLALLAQQDFSHPGSDMPLPGNVSPVDRFQRAAYYSALLPAPQSEREAVAALLAIMRNVSVPFGAPYHDFGIYNTEYRTVTDLTHRRYFFELTTSPNVIWTDLATINLDAGQPVRVLDSDNIALSGDVSGQYTKADAPF